MGQERNVAGQVVERADQSVRTATAPVQPIAAVVIEFMPDGRANIHTTGNMVADLLAVAARLLLQLQEQTRQQATERRIVKPPPGLAIR